MAAPKKPAAAAEAVDTAIQSAMAPINSFQEKVRETAEKGMEQVRAQYETVKDAAEKATGKMEESFNVVKTGTIEFNVRALELARNNINASFDHMKTLFGAKSVQEFVTLNSDFAKAQMAVVSEQAKELAALSQKTATDAAEPVKSVVAFK